MRSSTTPEPGTAAEHGAESILAACEKLRPQFAARAAEYDRSGAFPKENFRELREAGLYGILVPEAYGGWGADFLTYTKALEVLGAGDASTALAFNMHNIVIGSLTHLDLDALEGRRGEGLRSFCEWVYREAAVDGKLFATAATEPGVGARLSQIKTTYRRVAGGFLINGVKSFVSMGGQADYCIVAARSDQDFGDLPGITYLVVERGNPGVRVEQTWDSMGMRATCSNTLVLEDCFVPADRLYLMEAVALYKAAREPHWLVGAYNGVYLGIAAAIFEFVREYIRGRTRADTGEPLSHDPLVQLRVGELCTNLEAVRAVTYDAARRVVEARGTHEANVAIHRAKYMVGELGPRMASAAICLCGGSTLSKSMPLERYYRDARCGGVMPAKSDECLTYVGKAMLGIDVMSPGQSYW